MRTGKRSAVLQVSGVWGVRGLGPSPGRYGTRKGGSTSRHMKKRDCNTPVTFLRSGPLVSSYDRNFPDRRPEVSVRVDRQRYFAFPTLQQNLQFSHVGSIVKSFWFFSISLSLIDRLIHFPPFLSVGPQTDLSVFEFAGEGPILCMGAPTAQTSKNSLRVFGMYVFPQTRKLANSPLYETLLFHGHGCGNQFSIFPLACFFKQSPIIHQCFNGGSGGVSSHSKISHDQ